jgi:Zn-dependent protease
MNFDKIFEGALWYLAFLLSTTLHEAAHGFTAMRLGDMTAYEGGQVTLDPFPHIRREPFGMVLVPIISYFLGGWMIGWASVPYNYEWSVQHPRRSGLMSLAGPTANLFLVVLAAGVIRIGLFFHLFFPPPSITFAHVTTAAGSGFITPVATFLSIIFSLNLLLLLFNLLPLPPLDGSGIVTIFLSKNTAQKYVVFVRRSPLVLVGLFLAWNLFGYVFPPIHLQCINLLYPGLHYY